MDKHLHKYVLPQKCCYKNSLLTQQFFSTLATFPRTPSCKIHFTAQCIVPLLLYRLKTDTQTPFPNIFLPVGCAEEQRGWHSPKSAPSIPEKLMGYLCNKPAHPSQVYATLHSLYLPWFAGLCKLGKQAQSDSFPFCTGRDPLKEFQGGIRKLGTAGRKKKSGVPCQKEKLPEQHKQKELEKTENAWAQVRECRGTAPHEGCQIAEM